MDSCFNGIYEACGTPKSIEENGKTVIYYPWDNEGAECPYEYVKESEDEVMELYKQAYNLREELYKKYEVVEKQKTKNKN